MDAVSKSPGRNEFRACEMSVSKFAMVAVDIIGREAADKRQVYKDQKSEDLPRTRLHES